MKSRLASHLAAVASAAFVSVALAHGDEHPDATRKYDASRVEPTDFGQEGDPATITRTVTVDMADTMRFTPAELSVKRGETVKFIVRNSGNLVHEMVLGTPLAIKEHAELMKKFPNMDHEDANIAHVKPGGSGEIVWQFSETGELQFACLQPGHFEAGMKGTIKVAETNEPSQARTGTRTGDAKPSGDYAIGEVRRVDTEQNKITLRHGELSSVGMPPMTMVFRVRDPQLIAATKAGDKVWFKVIKDADGAMVVTDLKPAQ